MIQASSYVSGLGCGYRSHLYTVLPFGSLPSSRKFRIDNRTEGWPPPFPINYQASPSPMGKCLRVCVCVCPFSACDGFIHLHHKRESGGFYFCLLSFFLRTNTHTHLHSVTAQLNLWNGRFDEVIDVESFISPRVINRDWCGEVVWWMLRWTLRMKWYTDWPSLHWHFRMKNLAIWREGFTVLLLLFL